MKTSMNIKISKNLFISFKNKVKMSEDKYHSHVIKKIIINFIENNSIEKDNEITSINFSIEEDLKIELKSFIKKNNLNITMTQVVLNGIKNYIKE